MKMKNTSVLLAICSTLAVAAFAAEKKAITDNSETKREYQLVMGGEVAACYLTSIGEAAQPGRSVSTASVVVQHLEGGILYLTHTSHPKDGQIVTVAAYVKEKDIKERQFNVGGKGYSKPSENKEVEFEVETENRVEVLVPLNTLDHAKVQTWKLDTTQGELAPLK
jgi:hypothetical protein